MLDLRFLTDNLSLVREKTSSRRTEVDFPRLEELIVERRDLIHRVETTRFEQRQSQQLMKTIDKSGQAFKDLRAQLKDLSNEVKSLDEQRKQTIAELDDLLMLIPNLIHDSVPLGDSEDDNPVIREVGEKTCFDFEIVDHAQLGENLNVLDFEAGGRVAGARFSVIRGQAARLNRVLVNFMLDLHTMEHDYFEILPPFLVNRAAMTGTGQLPKFEEDAFQTDDLFLIPTAEVPVTNIHRGEILDAADLPCSYVAYSPCFRREAGSYGVDTRGLIRQHQFEKVELVKFVRPEESYEQHEKLLANAERVLQLLELPYRVISLCSADIGFSAAKCYDIEVWIPSQNRYREISSCSNFEDFQARRANIRFRSEKGAKPAFVHTLNGSGLAIGRTLVAILENYQNADGSVSIPSALVERMGFDKLQRSKN